MGSSDHFGSNSSSTGTLRQYLVPKMSEGLEDFAAVRRVIEDKLHQEFYNVPTKDLPPGCSHGSCPTFKTPQRSTGTTGRSGSGCSRVGRASACTRSVSSTPIVLQRSAVSGSKRCAPLGTGLIFLCST